MRMMTAIGVLASLGLAGCAGYRPATAGDNAKAAPMSEAVAMLKTATGADAGRATVRKVDGGLEVTVTAMGLPPGVHGTHVHTTGRCDAPDFATAGGHWNPTGKQHGTQNPMGPHEGDLPNLTVGADGTGTLSATIAGGTIDGLLDNDGAALVVHAGPDDMKTDPAGNSGGRIACGVFSAA